jgi:hypothetical protein
MQISPTTLAAPPTVQFSQHIFQTLIQLNIQQGYAMTYILSTSDNSTSFLISTDSIMQDIQNENVL